MAKLCFKKAQTFIFDALGIPASYSDLFRGSEVFRRTTLNITPVFFNIYTWRKICYIFVGSAVIKFKGSSIIHHLSGIII